jgi:trans-aconitate 2-methyltransferase
MPTWDPTTYARFSDERSRAFGDLLARVGAVSPGMVVDLGSGPGALTATLADRWPAADVLGVDSSPDMVASAQRFAGPTLRFELGDVREWTPDAAVDVLVSNAVLQWVPDHLDLVARWVGWLAPGGWLALQVPGNFDAPSHALMRDVAARPAFRDRLAGVLRGPESVHDPMGYAEVLAAAGCDVDAWETTYLHVLDPEGAHGDAVLAWVSGTGLRPVLDVLADDPALRERFVDEYAAELRIAYPRKDFGTPLPFRRVFAVAHRPPS